jgi:hypothetical protein
MFTRLSAFTTSPATDLLAVLAPRMDRARVVRAFNISGNDNLPLIKPYLVAVQRTSRLWG